MTQSSSGLWTLNRNTEREICDEYDVTTPTTITPAPTPEVEIHIPQVGDTRSFFGHAPIAEANKDLPAELNLSVEVQKHASHTWEQFHRALHTVDQQDRTKFTAEYIAEQRAAVAVEALSTLDQLANSKLVQRTQEVIDKLQTPPADDVPNDVTVDRIAAHLFRMKESNRDFAISGVIHEAIQDGDTETFDSIMALPRLVRRELGLNDKTEQTYRAMAFQTRYPDRVQKLEQYDAVMAHAKQSIEGVRHAIQEYVGGRK